jgi:putative sterol carrier protein
MSLLQSLMGFAVEYHARPELVAEQRGWSRTISLQAHDSGEEVGARVDDGLIVELYDEPRSSDVTIRSDAATLREILELRRSANEPYLFGELTVHGSEADFLRLDYITGCLCPR